MWIYFFLLISTKIHKLRAGSVEIVKSLRAFCQFTFITSIHLYYDIFPIFTNNLIKYQLLLTVVLSHGFKKIYDYIFY